MQIGKINDYMEDNKEELPIPSDQIIAVEKVEQFVENISFTKGILTYEDVGFSEYRRKVDTRKFLG